MVAELLDHASGSWPSNRPMFCQGLPAEEKWFKIRSGLPVCLAHAPCEFCTSKLHLDPTLHFVGLCADARILLDQNKNKETPPSDAVLISFAYWVVNSDGLFHVCEIRIAC